MASKKHVARVRRELKAAGVTPYGFLKLSTRYVPEVVQLDERIGGAVYGWGIVGGSAVLIATDRRILFIDKKPFFQTTDELTYDIVSGVKIHTGGPFCTVILHTRRNDYRLRYVNEDCARNFVKFIEQRRIHPGRYDHQSGEFTHAEQEQDQPGQQTAAHSENAASFINAHHVGILSTVNHRRPHGSVVQYMVDENGYIYLATTPDSRKVQNVVSNPQVSLTVFELETEMTARLEGHASIEQNHNKIMEVTNELYKHKTAQYERFTQNVSMHQQDLVIIRIDPSRMELTNYRKKQNH
ncbi:MAG: pyridoxamine 5'-phosphate oxidase family protein [Candidatus Saccharibacteria bacterium]|nr:pyridoxamine 5'-phosphate oxidase family protein [Candidatus Saccharibacteria bacterium]